MVFMMLLLNIITIGFIHIFTRVTITIDRMIFIINSHVLVFHHINYGVWFYLSKSVYIHFSVSIKVSEPLNWYVLIRDRVCYVTRLMYSKRLYFARAKLAYNRAPNIISIWVKSKILIIQFFFEYLMIEFFIKYRLILSISSRLIFRFYRLILD